MKSSFKINFIKGSLAVMAMGAIASCSKLEPKVKDPLSVATVQAGTAPTPPSLSKVYEQLNQLVTQVNWYAMEEHTTDELIGPTRGTDWDDFGTWRKLHLHTWDGSHNQINDTWNGLNGALFQSTLVAETASGQTKAEAQFLRAYFSYLVCDLFGQVQHRPATAAADVIPEVFTRSQACDFIISELQAAIPNLPSYTPGTRSKATKEAAKFLLAKTLLNKAVYKQDPGTPAGPYTFAAADMSQVITLCNEIAGNASLSLNNYYWDNFTWNNGTTSTENIFVRKNSEGINVVWATCMGQHYAQAPSGWNGFTTLADFYNTFDAADVRRNSNVPGFTSQTGVNAGFLVGQIQGPSGGQIGGALVNLKDRSGNPLVFTSDVSLFFSTETKGIRTMKYPLNPAEINGGGWGSSNDFVFFRLADVRLMKAEALLRGGTDPNAETATNIVNAIRAKRGVGNLGTVNLTTLLEERGREMYLEGWRRNDLIRFGKFNAPVGERPNASAGTKVVFPIPNIALSSNPNLKQNAGY
ncbi:MAG: RagB/SusD family nutrient uptake outer membrane protein [Ferruginibacter sp.]